MSDLIYRPDTHSYWMGRQQIPGITRVLKDLGYYGEGARFFTGKSRDRGTGAHKACAMVDQLAPAAQTMEEVHQKIDMHPDLNGYVQGYLLFKREKRYRPVAWEQPICDTRLRIAGTPDSYGFIDNGGTPINVVVDEKSWKNQGANPKRSAELQVAAYALMLQRQGNWLNPPERWVLKLPGDGRYRLYHCDNPQDLLMVPYLATVWYDLYRADCVRLEGDPDDESAA